MLQEALTRRSEDSDDRARAFSPGFDVHSVRRESHLQFMLFCCGAGGRRRGARRTRSTMHPIVLVGIVYC